MYTKIISVFPACGKTYLKNNEKKIGLKILDSDSSNFSWVVETIDGEEVKRRNPKFPKNYIDHIVKNIGKYDYIFVSSHAEVRKALGERPGLLYGVVYPERDLLMEWIARCEGRENNGFPIEVLMNNWDSWISQMEEDGKDHKEYVLGPGEYLSSALNKVDWFYSVNVTDID